MGLSEAQAYITFAATAFAADDMDGAERNFGTAQILMAGVPNSGMGGASLQIRDAITTGMDMIAKRRAQLAVGTKRNTIQSAEVNYV